MPETFIGFIFLVTGIGMKQANKVLELELERRKLKFIWDDARQMMIFEFKDRQEPSFRLKFGAVSFKTIQNFRASGFRNPLLAVVQRTVENTLEAAKEDNDTYEDLLLIDEILSNPAEIVSEYFLIITPTLREPMNVH